MKSFLMVLIPVTIFAMSDVSVPNTFVDSAVIEASEFNDNFVALRNYINALIDTLELRFARFTDVKDTTFQKINVDSIRSKPDIDSIQGRPWIDSVKTLHIEANQADINGGTADGVIIGATSAQDATFDSVHIRIVTTDSVFASLDTTMILSVYGITGTPQDTVKCLKFGKSVTLRVYAASGTSTSTVLYIGTLPVSLRPPSRQIGSAASVFFYDAGSLINEPVSYSVLSNGQIYFDKPTAWTASGTIGWAYDLIIEYTL